MEIVTNRGGQKNLNYHGQESVDVKALLRMFPMERKN